MRVLMWIAICFLGGAAVAVEPERQEWRVDGVTREGLVYAPATAIIASAPVIFAFHGHGGTMKNAARSFAYHTEWPEAITVYLQGLNTPGKLTDPEGKKPGWQSSPGDQQDRDLKFYDIVLASLKKDYKVDDKRIFSTGTRTVAVSRTCFGRPVETRSLRWLHLRQYRIKTSKT